MNLSNTNNTKFNILIYRTPLIYEHREIKHSTPT